MTTRTFDASQLAHFTGSETWYRHLTGNTFTDGVKFLADNAGAYWLIDEILFAQHRPRVRAEEFQVWKLAVLESSAVLTCEDGNRNKVYTKKIAFTDFPLPQIELFFTNRVVLLPSEY